MSLLSGGLNDHHSKAKGIQSGPFQLINLERPLIRKLPNASQLFNEASAG
jgi:hypothetical protein